MVRMEEWSAVNISGPSAYRSWKHVTCGCIVDAIDAPIHRCPPIIGRAVVRDEELVHPFVD